VSKRFLAPRRNSQTTFAPTPQCYKPNDPNPEKHRCENLKSCKIKLLILPVVLDGSHFKGRSEFSVHENRLLGRILDMAGESRKWLNKTVQQEIP
jgi:hypothetical protein